ncbi:MAG TPA: manganese efflux pump [Acidimicrobiales bacterium]|nr:manganese efflux pump [Acidimicrobiales bacterium]
MLALLLVAVSVGLSNFAASASMGVLGVDRRLRIRVALLFGVAEGVAPVLGLLLGRSFDHAIGTAAKPIGGALLGAAGLYTIAHELFGDKRQNRDPGTSTARLVFVAAALSIDNLVIGFALGTYHVNVLVAAVTIATVSVVLSLTGLELGRVIGARTGRWAGLIGGTILVIVGIAVGIGVI